MLKNVCLFLALVFGCLIYLTLQSKVFASDWIKYPQNPIFTDSAGWDQHVASPTIIFEDNKLKMWYQGAGNLPWSIGYAESADGINWQRPVSNPLLIPQNETGVIETAIVEPSVVKNIGYQMWFNSQNRDIYNIRYASSSNGINWTKRSGYNLRGQSLWELKGVANPHVIYKDGKYLMWYNGWGYSSPWKIGYAESNDGINWTKYSGNPLNLPNLGHVAAPSVAFFNNQFHMFYHTGGGIPDHIYHVVSNDGKNWSCSGSCQVLATSTTGFDSSMIVYPEILNYQSQLYLYYTGYNGQQWQIGLASEQPIINNKIPLIIIPGMFASWNNKAIVYNESVNQDDWKLNPFVKEYDGIKETITNLGYQENRDFFIYPYDWRKDLNNLAVDFNDYLLQIVTRNPQLVNFNIVGHSLGGLVGRIYGQKYGPEIINKLVTVGSPHQGVAQVYKPVEAGELDRTNDAMWLAEKLLLQLYRDGIKTDKQIVNEKIPVVKDLLPTNNFLKNKYNQEINISEMTIKNDTLLSYQSTFPDLFSILSTIVGEINNTLSGYKIGTRTVIDQLLDLYPDGRPLENYYEIGDYLVLSSSAQAGNNNKLFNFDHGKIIYKKEAIKEILNLLALPYQENQIVEGSGTKISPSLLFLILSPATMEVKFNNSTYIEQDGLIFIDDAQSGVYQLNIRGIDQGPYQILIGQVSENKDQWFSLYGSITSEVPHEEIDHYQINFNNINPRSFPVFYLNLGEYFDSLMNQVVEINANIDNVHLNNSLRHLNEAKENYLTKDFKKLQLNLENTHNELFKARKELDDIIDYRLFNFILELENIYQLSLNESDIEVTSESLSNQLTKLQQSITKIENKLLKDKNSGQDVTQAVVKLQSAIEKYYIANESYQQKNYFSVQILLMSTEEILKEI